MSELKPTFTQELFNLAHKLDRPEIAAPNELTRELLAYKFREAAGFIAEARGALHEIGDIVGAPNGLNLIAMPDFIRKQQSERAKPNAVYGPTEGHLAAVRKLSDMGYTFGRDGEWHAPIDDADLAPVRQGMLDGEPCAIVQGEVKDGFWFPTTSWQDDVIDLLHAVAGNLSPENRVLAKEAKRLIGRQEAK